MSDRPLAVVLLRKPIRPANGSIMAARLRAEYPGDPEEMQPALQGPAIWPIMRTQGQDLISVLQVETPVAREEILARAAEAYWWREAAEVVTEHTAHLIVAPISPIPPEPFRAVSAARATTRLAAALAVEAGRQALGVLWMSAQALYPVATFRARAKEALPLPLWADLRPLRGEHPREVGLASRGLRLFTGHEVRFEPTAQVPLPVLAQRCLGLAGYLLTSGAAVRDGDTIGVSAQERLAVREAEDATLGGRILSITVESMAWTGAQ